MFYGLNKFIKKILPKQLFYRALLIVALPIIILQLTITFVFFDSLWIKTNKGMTRALAGEIKTYIDAYNKNLDMALDVNKFFRENLNLDAKYIESENLPKNKTERWFSPIDRTLRRELKSRFSNYWFDTTSYKNLIDIKIAYKNGYFQFYIPKERVANSSVRMFALWITLPAFLLITIALLFLKNQTRPITRLAKASEKFGKGEDVEEFIPSGALEIRQAGYEFEKMRKRILRHLNQRSEMLSGISHDLRTPLTRIKLQLSFIKDKEISKKLSEDVDEMEKMLNEYLQFARSQFSEKTTKINLKNFIKNLVSKYENTNIKLELSESNIEINVRANLMQRCVENLINNSIKYSTKIYIKLIKSSSHTVISIDDDGPGIPINEYENVFKPFYKIDKSRGDSKSSVGLGLSIANDIVKSHGGSIKLDKSSFGGLQVKIFLPS
tara:strand:- start:48 stop:1364 length:1317 start_codon:yes stop_codon:yes gene_type:complete